MTRNRADTLKPLHLQLITRLVCSVQDRWYPGTYQVQAATPPVFQFSFPNFVKCPLRKSSHCVGDAKRSRRSFPNIGLRTFDRRKPALSCTPRPGCVSSRTLYHIDRSHFSLKPKLAFCVRYSRAPQRPGSPSSKGKKRITVHHEDAPRGAVTGRAWRQTKLAGVAACEATCNFVSGGGPNS